MPPSDDAGFGRAVQHTRELARVLNIPRRIWTLESAEQVARELTALLRKASGTMDLRPIQGQALLEAGIIGGLFGPIRVGGGKTLLSLLAPFVLDAKRPLLVIPAKLVEKTKRERLILSQHWHIPTFFHIVSYEWLGRVQAQDFLEKRLQPDLIILDEAHKVKNPKAAVTRRIARYFHARPDTKCVAISGTITKRSLKEWAHIAAWCLPPQSYPLPHSFSEREDWADAVDEKPNGESRLMPGYLTLLCSPEERAEPDTLVGLRKAFRRRLVETKGVVATTEGHVGCSLTIEALEVDVKKDVDDAFDILRKTWSTPDNWPITDPLQLWRVARELSLGFYYRWEPRPPDDWMSARREWSRACREILSNNRLKLDSLLMVTRAIQEGDYPDVLPILNAWRTIEPTFTPNPVPVWLDDSLVRAAKHWAEERPGIVWCEHVAFAERLAKLAKLAYYGRGGLDHSTGRPIEAHPADVSLVASVASNAEGRNLQKWSRNLVTSCPASCGGSTGWEQLLGRTHRPGQDADEVECQVFVTSIEHVNAFQRACSDAVYIEHTTGQAQKLLYADKLVPSPDDVMFRQGFRWRK